MQDEKLGLSYFIAPHLVINRLNQIAMKATEFQEEVLDYFNFLFSKASENAKEKKKKRNINDPDEKKLLDDNPDFLNIKKIEIDNTRGATLYAIWTDEEYPKAARKFELSRNALKNCDIRAFIQLVFTHLGQREKKLLNKWKDEHNLACNEIINRDCARDLLREYFYDSIVRRKWKHVVTERCEKLNILGISYIQRQENINNLWQAISLKSTTETLMIDSSVKSMKKFIETISQEKIEGKKVIIYGNQGLGKTSLLKFLAMKCIDDETDFLKDCVPIFLSLPRIYEYYQLDSNDLFESIQDWIRSKSNITLTELEDTLNSGKVLFLFDRIDYNSRIFNAVTKFVDKYKKNNFILTTNQQVNDSQIEFPNFQIFEIMGFKENHESRRSFVKKWFQNHTLEQEKADSLIELIENYNNDSPLVDANSPLFLQFLCLAFFKNPYEWVSSDEETNVSDEEPNLNLLLLYQDALFALIEHVEVDEIDNPIFDPQDKIYSGLNKYERIELLSYIAFQMVKDEKVYAKINELSTYICKYFHTKNFQMTMFEIEKKGEAIIRSIEMQDGLLVNKMWDDYTFCHTTIREFFASYYISQNLSQWADLMNDGNKDKWGKLFGEAEKILEVNLKRFKKLRATNPPPANNT